MKRVVLSALASLSIAVPAMAAPVLPANTPLFFQFVNLEQVDTTLTNSIDVPGPYGTAGNWGVILITSIQEGSVTVPNQDIQGGGSFVFTNGGVGGTQVTGVFYDIQLDSGTAAHGGVLDLYSVDNGTIDSNCTSGQTCAPDAATVTKFTQGTFLGRILFASGIDPLNPTTTIKSSTDVTTLTGSGQADSFGNIDLAAGGAWASTLNGDWFNTPFGTRDIRFSNFFNLNPLWDGGAGVNGLRSNDPARVMTVPEPMSLTLLGLGLFGVGLRSRKR